MYSVFRVDINCMSVQLHDYICTGQDGAEDQSGIVVPVNKELRIQTKESSAEQDPRGWNFLSTCICVDCYSS